MEALFIQENGTTRPYSISMDSRRTLGFHYYEQLDLLIVGICLVEYQLRNMTQLNQDLFLRIRKGNMPSCWGRSSLGRFLSVDNLGSHRARIVEALGLLDQ